MSHWPVLPVVLPLFAGALLLLVERRRPAWQAPLSVASILALLAVALKLGGAAANGTIVAYLSGNWPAPFGIALAVDRLAALMLVLTAVVGLACLIAALDGWHRRGAHFHALLQFQLMGLNGAFLTADLFNLFVFFEVLLIASYGLLLHGGGGYRLRAGIHYVVFNLAGSALFLIAVGLIYGVTGTLNMADLAVQAAQVPAADAALLRAAALILILVFCVKAALLPLYFWLPDTYSAASPPVAALFAIMTKVGIYSIARVYTLVFGTAAGAASGVAASWLTLLALATVALAAFGALAATHLRGMIAYLMIGSAGTVLAAIGLYSGDALAGALFYLAQSTLIGAALFLLAGAIGAQRGDTGDRLYAGPGLVQPALLGGAFLVAAATVVGLPPFSGFVGKVLILDGALESSHWVAVWVAILGASLLGLIAVGRAGSLLFWNTIEEPGRSPPARRTGLATLMPIWALLGACMGLTFMAGPLQRYAAATAEQLLAPRGYVESVLGARAVTKGDTRQ